MELLENRGVRRYMRRGIKYVLLLLKWYCGGYCSEGRFELPWKNIRFLHDVCQSRWNDDDGKELDLFETLCKSEHQVRRRDEPWTFQDAVLMTIMCATCGRDIVLVEEFVYQRQESANRDVGVQRKEFPQL